MAQRFDNALGRMSIAMGIWRGGHASVPGRPAANEVAALRERLTRVSAELTLAKEAEVRELLRRLQGQTIPGDLLGTIGSVAVSSFTAIERYLSTDGQVELDALARGDESWAIEVRRQVSPASQADLKRFAAKAADVPIARRWFIARGGFRSQAVAYARTAGIYLTDHEAYRQLRELAGR
jgi:hypothetical protein